jgi:hypothetical protein
MGQSCLIGCFRVLRVPCVCMCMSMSRQLSHAGTSCNAACALAPMHVKTQLAAAACACTVSVSHAPAGRAGSAACVQIPGPRSAAAIRCAAAQHSAAHDGPAPCACTRPVSPQAIPSIIHATHNPPLLLLRRRCGDACLPGGTLCPGAAARPLPRCECQSQQRRCLHSQSCQPQQ